MIPDQSGGPESCGMCWRGPGSNSACSEHRDDYVRRLEQEIERLSAQDVDGVLAVEFLSRMLSSDNRVYVDLGDNGNEPMAKVCLDGWAKVTPGELAMLRRLRDQNLADGT